MDEVILAGANCISVVHEPVITMFCPYGNKKPNCVVPFAARAEARRE